MAKYESSVKQIAAPQHSVYARLSDLSNLSVLRERLNDPAAQEMLRSKMNEEQMEQAKRQLEALEFTSDSLSFDQPPLGRITIEIIEREPDKCIKFRTAQSPIPVTIWVQILPTSETTSKLRLTLDAELSAFMKMMVDKHLKEGVEKMADMLASIPY